MKKILTIVLLSFIICHAQSIAQIVEERQEGDFDSTLLSVECNLNKDELGKIFTKLEILADFPGGFKKWFEFANSNFDFTCILKGIGDTVQLFQDSLVVKFIVARNGNICNVQILNGNPILINPTLKLLKSSSKWTPGVNGGRQLNSYRSLRVDVYIDRKQGIRTIKHFTNSYFRENN